MPKFMVDQERREITAPVMIPNEVDYHGHIYDEETVYKACRNYQKNCNKASLQHSLELSKSSAYFVEHYISPTEMLFEDSDTIVKKGSWMATMSFPSDTLWEDAKTGKYKGFSIQAGCKAMKVKKSKVAGRQAAEEGIEVDKRLFDIDFSAEDHHVALVDEAANATEVLVVKAKHLPGSPAENKPDDPSNSESVIEKKEETMSLEDLELEKKKSLELETQELEVKKAKEDQEAELLELRKDKEASEMIEMVSKAKDLKADDADKFAIILTKCKGSLDSEEYLELSKQLEKIVNLTDNKKILEDLGESEVSEEKLVKAKETKFNTLRTKYITEGLPASEASKKARLESDSE